MAQVCGGCGDLAPDGAVFCGTCGTRVAPDATVAVSAPNTRLATIVIVLVAIAAVAFPLGKWALAKPSVAAAAPALPLKPVSSRIVKPVKCMNAQAKFTITVPAAWTDQFTRGPCTQFSVPLPRDESPYVATVQISPDAGPFDQLHVTGKAVSTKEGNVADRPATVYETTYSDNGAETHAYGYLLQVGDEAFSIRLLNFPQAPVPTEIKKTFNEVVRELKINS